MDSLGQFALRDVFDVLIVAYVLYRVMLLIRGTRAVRMAVGLLLMFVAYIVARQLELRTLDWVLSNVFTYFIFALLILFQQEFRKALASLGRTPFFGGLSPAVTKEPFDDIISAATAMAAERRGALIVFERGVGLKNYIDQGIPLDAVITYDLLFSLFHTHSALHDGAVIVQGNRLAAGSCFVPLTTNPRLSRDLGSRHRAAIGITEETDALALVVSEETGGISLAVDGKITRRLDAATLRKRLTELLVVEDEAASGQSTGTGTPGADSSEEDE
ncbi:MAG: TIGR00159 family protein [Acidobacteria bacterium]|nr:TIGR00159 family protein [Acidobacteriota bacterium]